MENITNWFTSVMNSITASINTINPMTILTNLPPEMVYLIISKLPLGEWRRWLEYFGLPFDLPLLLRSCGKGKPQLYLDAVNNGDVETVKCMLEMELIHPRAYNFYGLNNAALLQNLDMLNVFLADKKTLATLDSTNAASVCKTLMRYDSTILEKVSHGNITVTHYNPSLKYIQAQVIISKLIPYLRDEECGVIGTASTRNMQGVISRWLATIKEDNIDQYMEIIHNVISLPTFSNSADVLGLFLKNKAVEVRCGEYLRNKIKLLQSRKW